MTEPPHSPLRRFAIALVRLPLLVLVTIYFLIDDVVLAAIRPIVAWAAELRLFTRMKLWLDGLSAPATLVLFLVPFVVLEPFKIGALVLLAKGQMVIGGTMLATSHLLSIVLVERLFHATRDKLLTIRWFAWTYGRVMAVYDWSVGRLRATRAWIVVAAAMRRLRLTVRVTWSRVKRMLAPVVAPVKAGAFALLGWLRRAVAR